MIDGTPAMDAGDERPLESVPPSPPLRRQLGLLRRMFEQPHAVLDELRAEYGPVVRLGAGPLRMVVVGAPVALTEMFAMSTESFRWNHRFNVLGFVVGKRSMIVSDGELHRRRRRAVQSAFSRKRLNGWIPMILGRADLAADLAGQLAHSRSGPIDLYPIGRSLVLGVAVEAFFGGDLAARTDEIGRLMQAPQDYLESPAIRQLPHPLPWTARAHVRADRKALDAIIDDAIERRRASAVADPDDVLDQLVSDGVLDDAEIRDQVVTLIGAGYDTTAATLAWALVCASRTPGVWGRLQEEADRVLPADPAQADHTTLAALTFADAVVHETLRLHPAGVLSPREAATDMTLGGHPITKGTMILWSPHLAGRDRDSWARPLEFDPDRFLAGGVHRDAVDIAWVPFGGGTRNCLGFALAQIELTLVLSRLAQRLDLEPPISSIPEPVGMVVNRPVGGAPALVARRVAIDGADRGHRAVP